MDDLCAASPLPVPNVNVVPTYGIVAARRGMRFCQWESRGDVFATHDGSQGWQDAQLLASGALGAPWPQGGTGDGGTIGRAGRAGTRRSSGAGGADHGA